MLKLKKDIFLTFLFTCAGSLAAVYCIAYILLKNFLLDNGNVMLVEKFNRVWLDIGFIAIAVFLISCFSIYRLQKRISQDTTALQNYLEEIDAKNYDAIIKIKYYTEYLHIAVLLKNLVKRVKNRDKKSA